MTTILHTYENDEGEDIEVHLPAVWCICDACRGEGKSSAYLGAFTGEQMREDPEFFQDYMDGAYDRSCDVCKGTGKVKYVDRDACTTEEQQKALARMDEAAEFDAECRRERDMESRMLGEH